MFGGKFNHAGQLALDPPVSGRAGARRQQAKDGRGDQSCSGASWVVWSVRVVYVVASIYLASVECARLYLTMDGAVWLERRLSKCCLDTGTGLASSREIGNTIYPCTVLRFMSAAPRG